ncbi:hypothetical protein IWX47DRAFT_261539 [Phyllosticta citricarpa]
MATHLDREAKGEEKRCVYAPRQQPRAVDAAAESMEAAAAAMDAFGACGRRVEGSEAGDEAIADERDKAERGVAKGRFGGRDVSKGKRHDGFPSTKAVQEGLDEEKDVVCRSNGSPNSRNVIAASDEISLDTSRSEHRCGSSSWPPRSCNSGRRRSSTTKPNEDQQPVAVAPHRGDSDVDDLHQTIPGSSPQSTRPRVSYTRPGTTAASSAASVIAAATAPLPTSSGSPTAKAPSEPVSAPVIVAPRTQELSSLLSSSTDSDAGSFADGGLLLRLEGIAAQSSVGASASGRSSSLPDVRNYGHRSAEEQADWLQHQHFLTGSPQTQLLAPESLYVTCRIERVAPVRPLGAHSVVREHQHLEWQQLHSHAAVLRALYHHQATASQQERRQRKR